jgi:hypothetical protein
MNAPGFFSSDLAIPAEFQARFDAQRGAFLKAPEPSHAERLADLRALARLLTENQTAIVAAIDADYGGRSGFETCSARSSPCWMGSATRESTLRAGCGRAGGASTRCSIPARATG